MTARYFCLAGEEYISQRELAQEYGYRLGPLNHHLTSIRCYLDEEYNAGMDATNKTGALRRRMLKLHQLCSSQEVFEQPLRELGIDELPAKLPLARLETYAAVLKAYRDGKLGALKDAVRQTLLMRFGLENGTCATLQEVGNRLGYTRERARQREEQGLALLGIASEEDE